MQNVETIVDFDRMNMLQPKPRPEDARPQAQQTVISMPGAIATTRIIPVEHWPYRTKTESGEIFLYRIQRNSSPPSGAFHPVYPAHLC